MKHHYTDLATALADPEGVAVLGFFYQVTTPPRGPSTARALRAPSSPTAVSFTSALRQRQPEVRPRRHRAPQHQGSRWVGFLGSDLIGRRRRCSPARLSCVTLLFSDGNTSLPPMSLAQLIPPEKNLTGFYRYKGSLTTPGCTESVIWTLFESPIPLSAEQVSPTPRPRAPALRALALHACVYLLCPQLGAFSELKFHGGMPMVATFRPVQPLNGRLVFYSGGTTVLTSSAFLVAAVAAAFGLSQPN